MSVSKA